MYYEVLVSGQRYHSEKPLTYASDSKLQNGSVVVVPLQQQKVLAIVLRPAKKPSFKTKDIIKVIDDQPVPEQLLELLSWVKQYYPGPSGQVVSLALPKTLATTRTSTATTEKDIASSPKKPAPLTQEQSRAIEFIHKAAPNNILLHGDTGTGKTRVYLELVKEAIAGNKSALILTPEIGLTPQLAATFQDTFPRRVVTIHSELGNVARRDSWIRILKSTEPIVVIGPRSALFTPIKGLGLIVIDEFHDSAYKQEQAPHYLATRVGAKLAKLHGAQLILGSATPPVSDYYTFSAKRLPIIRMTQPAVKNTHGKAIIEVVDIRDRELFGRSPSLSDILVDQLQQAFQDNKQSLIFLNRRGTARLVACQLCGWQASCPNCDLPLTYHGDTHAMQCHTCGYSSKAPSSCPECGANDIVFRSAGTKAIVSEIERLIPGAKVKRFDSDTAKADSLEQQFTSIRSGDVDILVGTQMIGKGLDLPRLSVVGIVTAETSLSFPDYSAEERTYQLITQALGRVSRGHTPGMAVVQTLRPDSALLHAAITKNYQAFYEQQLAERELYKFPPFRHTLKLTCSRATSATAKKNSQQLSKKLHQNKALEIVGPNPAFTERANGKYRWQIVVRSVRRQLLVDVIKELPTNWSYDIDPINLL